MLRLSKHTDPSLSVLNVAGLTIEILKNSEIISYNELLGALTERTSENVKEVYHYALSFLYLVGKLDYVKEIDGFRIIS